MSVNRYFKKCLDFSICCSIGDEGVVHAEHERERSTMYQIMVKGSGKIGIPFENNSVEIAKAPAFVDMKKYMGKHTVFQSDESFMMYGFNTLDKNQMWDAKLVTESFQGNDSYRLVCFDGRPIINGVELERMDYAQLENKDYNVQINDGMVGLFWKI
tara:strand:+ start:4427 stop:4897 length:471 start_codon:yes stop_codon:yes gene_type:complete